SRSGLDEVHALRSCTNDGKQVRGIAQKIYCVMRKRGIYNDRDRPLTHIERSDPAIKRGAIHHPYIQSICLTQDKAIGLKITEITIVKRYLRPHKAAPAYTNTNITSGWSNAAPAKAHIIKIIRGGRYRLNVVPIEIKADAVPTGNLDC